ncbi:hypothetical protein CLV51_10896 [Chitinophaga niastensis]|uniref:Uncharacterized protein n=1 Tax=Chitinophaga niastensis TaxID=536980 RepID=A0A2P8HB13_CHINA|nr:hypothetical protein [Chitinophaga niastensis]PSL43407.1 hypothetical protein CLV51_10896 [Chitinophaga niastensis]
MHGHSDNYTFNDQFFAHIRAPKYQLQKTTAERLGLGIFPPLDEIWISFLNKPDQWVTAASVGASVYDIVLEKGFMGAGDHWTALMRLSLPDSLPHVLRVRGLVLPNGYASDDKVSAWDVMGMEGNIHTIEAWWPYRGGMDFVQCVHSSATSHVDGESHPSGLIRFGFVFKEVTEKLPEGIYEKDTYQYTVDYKHIYVSPLSGSIVETLKTQCWPTYLDVSILHRDSGSYICEKKGEHILFRVL